jgi:hypothetical protein
MNFQIINRSIIAENDFQNAVKYLFSVIIDSKIEGLINSLHTYASCRAAEKNVEDITQEVLKIIVKTYKPSIELNQYIDYLYSNSNNIIKPFLLKRIEERICGIYSQVANENQTLSN